VSGAPIRTVMRIDRSPMNANLWCLTLSCGHTLWLTRSRWPDARTLRCAKCAPAPKEK
jgi:hypothetical protein